MSTRKVTQPYTEVASQPDRGRVEGTIIVREKQSSGTTTTYAAMPSEKPTCPETGEKGKEKEATTINDRPGVGGMEPLDMLNLLQLSTQPLDNVRVNATVGGGTQAPKDNNNAAGTESTIQEIVQKHGTAASNKQVRVSVKYSTLSNVLEEEVLHRNSNRLNGTVPSPRDLLEF